MTLPAYMEIWLRDKRSLLEQTSYDYYEIVIRRHLEPYFDRLGKEMDEITPRDIKDYVTDRLTGSRLDGKPGGLSRIYVRKHLAVLKEIYSDAVLDQVVSVSPAACVRLPAVPAMAPCTRFLTVEDARAIIKAFEGHWLYEMVLIALYYGLRKSEILGLKWSAVDFENDLLYVRSTVTKANGIYRKDRMKNPNSRGVYALIPDVRKALVNLRERQLQEREAVREEGYPYYDSEYIFVWPGSGLLFRPDTVVKSFQRVLRSHDIPAMRFHDLRHGTASILFDRGWSLKDVQAWLRHADASTTLNVYVHYQRDRKLQVAEDLQGLFREE